MVKQHVLSVSYYLFDDSGKSAVTLTISHATQKLFTAQVPIHPTGNDKAELQKASLPPSLVLAGARVCVVGTDPAGNRSPPSCKKLTLR